FPTSSRRLYHHPTSEHTCGEQHRDEIAVYESQYFI
ncbi:unnamed protein product, partial [Rotaria sordida]